MPVQRLIHQRGGRGLPIFPQEAGKVRSKSDAAEVCPKEAPAGPTTDLPAAIRATANTLMYSVATESWSRRKTQQKALENVKMMINSCAEMFAVRSFVGRSSDPPPPSGEGIHKIPRKSFIRRRHIDPGRPACPRLGRLFIAPETARTAITQSHDSRRGSGGTNQTRAIRWCGIRCIRKAPGHVGWPEQDCRSFGKTAKPGK